MLSQVMVEQVNTSVLDQVHTGEFHDLPDFCPVSAPVALALTLFAHRFWVVYALQPHAYAVGQKSPALRADKDFFLFDLFNIQLFQGKGSLLALVVFAAVNGDKADQHADVRSFL